MLRYCRLNYGEYLYSIGVIDFYQRQYFEQEEQKAKDFIANKSFAQANHVTFITFEFLLFKLIYAVT